MLCLVRKMATISARPTATSAADTVVTKNTKIAEKLNFKFSANFFNAFNNHYLINSQGGNYGGPSVAFVTDIGTTNTTNPFGSWNKAVSTPRTIQFAGRIEF